MILPLFLAIISLFRSGTRKLLENFKRESKEEAAVGKTGGVRPSFMTTQKMTHFTIRDIDFLDAIRNLSILLIFFFLIFLLRDNNLSRCTVR